MDSILIVDDEPGIRDTLRGVMEDEGFSADAVATGEEMPRRRRASRLRLHPAGRLAARDRRPRDVAAIAAPRARKLQS